MSDEIDNPSGNFTEVHHSCLDVFVPTPRDTSIIEYQYTEILNKDGSALNQKDTLSQYEIFNNDRDTWMNLSDSYLECRFKICPAANPNQGATNFNIGNISFVNGAFNLFKRAEYYVDNKLVQGYDQPGVINLVKGLIDNSIDSEKQLSDEFWYPDRGNGGTSGNYPEFRIITAGLQYYQLLIASGSGANPHLLEFNPLQGQAAIPAGAVIGIFYNNFPVTIFINNAVVAGLVSAGGGANATITNIANGNAVSFLVNGLYGMQQLLLTSENGLATTFVGGAGNLMFFNNGTGNADLIDTTLIGGLNGGIIVNGSTISNTGFQSRKNRSCGGNIDSPLIIPTGNAPALGATPYSGIVTGTGLYDKIITVYLPLRKLFSFFDFNRILMKGVVHRILLYRNDQARMIYRDYYTNYTGNPIGNADQDGRVVMFHVSWWVPRVLPNRLWEANLNKQLADGKSVALGWHEYNYYSYGTQQNALSTTFNSWKITTETHKPTRIYVFFQNINCTQDQHYNSMIFPAQPIATISIRINGVRYPLEEYSCDFTPAQNGTSGTPQWQRVYTEFLKAGYKAHTSNTGPAISYEEFLRLYQIFVFDLSAQDDEKIWTSQTTADIEVRATLNSGFTSNVYAYSIVESLRQMELTGVNNGTKMLM